jgi:heat shock protein HslJ
MQDKDMDVIEALEIVCKFLFLPAMKKTLNLLLCLAALALHAQDQHSVLTGEWNLTYIQVDSGKPEFNPYYIRNGVELRLRDDGSNGQFEAHDMCNRAAGKYTIPKAGKFVVLEINVSDRSCNMDWPENFWQIFQNISSFILVGDNLYLKYNSDKNVMAFEKKVADTP